MRAQLSTVIALACALLISSRVWAQADASAAAEPPQLSDKAADELGKLRELFEQKKTTELIAGLNRVIPTLANPSYDRAMFNQALAQAYLMAGDEKAAMGPIAEAIKQGFLDKKTAQDFRFYLAQLHYQFGNVAQALDVLKQWYQAGPINVTREQQLFYAALLYEQKEYEESLVQVNASLARVETPIEQQLMLKFGVLTELKRNGEAAEVLERVVALKPSSATNWQQLLQAYMAASENVRAIVTMERAMALGHFATARDYFTLVGLYYNLEQFPHVVELIENGFSSGKLPPDASNWELLAGAWMLIGDFRKASEVYQRAAKVVPGGDMDFARSQLLYNEGKIDDALASTRAAWNKGEFKKTPKDRVIRQLAGLAVEARNAEQLEYAIGKMKELNLEKEAKDFEPWLRDLKGE